MNVRICPALGASVVGLFLIAGAAERDWTVTALGVAVLLVGSMALCTRAVCDKLDKVNRPADEAWTEGYESGYDKGWRDGNNAARPTLRVMKDDDGPVSACGGGGGGGLN
jgi:hypothetical protein